MSNSSTKGASIADELEGLPGVVECVGVEYRRGRDILPYDKRWWGKIGRIVGL